MIAANRVLVDLIEGGLKALLFFAVSRTRFTRSEGVAWTQQLLKTENAEILPRLRDQA